MLVRKTSPAGVWGVHWLDQGCCSSPCRVMGRLGWGEMGGVARDSVCSQWGLVLGAVWGAKEKSVKGTRDPQSRRRSRLGGGGMLSLRGVGGAFAGGSPDSFDG